MITTTTDGISDLNSDIKQTMRCNCQQLHLFYVQKIVMYYVNIYNARGNAEMKYESWILAKREVAADRSSFSIINNEGQKLRSIEYTYACPHCHKEYHCYLSNRLTFRKCRYCNQPVSPYQGEIIESAWMSDAEADEFNQTNEHLIELGKA